VPTQLTLIGGYLGAGKTTLVNRMLRAAHQPFAVIVNDLGALPIDEALIETRSSAMVTLTNGCACCQIGADLSMQVDKLASQGFDWLVVETSGVARLSRLMVQLMQLPGIQLNSAMAVVDGLRIEQLLESPWVSEIVEDQLNAAQLIVATRAFPDWHSTRSLWHQRTKFLEAEGALPYWIWQTERAQAVPSPKGSDKPEFQHRAVTVSSSMNASDLERFIVSNPQVQRVKGFANLSGQRYLIQSGVGYCRIELSEAGGIDGVQFIWTGSKAPAFEQITAPLNDSGKD
jgi:hypothetical protein